MLNRWLWCSHSQLSEWLFRFSALIVAHIVMRKGLYFWKDKQAQGLRKITKWEVEKEGVVIIVNCQQQQPSITFHDLCVQKEL